MKQFRLFLQTVVLAAVALSMSLQANISPLAFNGIFKCFKPGYEMYAPNLGCAALQTGLVNALRFYTTIPGGHHADGRRMWINDQAPADDPVAALALLLFPSPAGNLTAMTSHPENIGRNLTVNHVAQLLNLCAHIRATVGHMGGNRFGNDARKCLGRLNAAANKQHQAYPDNRALFKKNHDELVNLCALRTAVNSMGPNLFGNDAIKCFKNRSSCRKALKAAQQWYVNKPQLKDNYFSRSFSLSNKYNPKATKCSLDSLLFSDQGRKVIVALCKIIEHEERITEKRFYPKYQAEQLLNAFFCLKFGKDDIPELLENLDNSLVDHEQLIDARLIDSSDIERVKQKNLDAITLDDLWVIQNRDLIDQVIPYPRGCKPVNNDLASGYDRAQDRLLNNKDQEFADCTETILRHVCTLVLDSKEEFFNLEKIRYQLKNSPIKNLLRNFEAFYALQSRDKANSGERLIRDAWCKVVGDLGTPVRYRKKSVRTNTKNDTEVDSGIINIIRVLNIIFNLGLDKEPVYLSDKQFEDDVKTWATNGLQKLFKTISPEIKDDYITISNVSAVRAFGNEEYDCSGTINITVKPDFEFTMSVSKNHAQFGSIDILVPEQASINKAFLNQVTNKFQNAFSGKTTESIFLLNNKAKDIITTPAYTLFKNGLRDSTQSIDTLEILLEMTQKSEISLTRSAQILKNLLHNFLWQDQAMTVNIQLILKKWTRFALESDNHGIKDALQDEVKSIEYDLFSEDFKNNADDFLEFFHEATTIFCSEKNDVSSFVLLRKHQSIKKIDLSYSAITELEISGDTCPNLEWLNLSSTKQLTSLKLSGSFQNVKYIGLPKSAIKELEISGDTCPNLKWLNLNFTPSLINLKLSCTLQKLTSIGLISTRITALEISGDTCPNLETLNLSETSELNSLTLSGIFQRLKSIEIPGSAITELEISGNMFPKLETLNLSWTENLKILKLSEILQNLKIINISRSKIQKLEFSGDRCPNLEELVLFDTPQLNNVKLPGSLLNLRTINISRSAVTEITIRPGSCPNLQSTDPRIKINDLKRKDRDEEIDDQEQPDAKKQCLNDIREN